MGFLILIFLVFVCLILLKDFMEVHVCEIPIYLSISLSSVIYLAIYPYLLFICLSTYYWFA